MRNVKVKRLRKVFNTLDNKSNNVYVKTNIQQKTVVVPFTFPVRTFTYTTYTMTNLYKNSFRQSKKIIRKS